MRMQVSRKYIRACFKDAKVQISEGAVDDIVYHLRMKVSKMSLRSKEGNIKRLTSQLFYLALGRYNDIRGK